MGTGDIGTLASSSADEDWLFSQIWGPIELLQHQALLTKVLSLVVTLE